MDESANRPPGVYVLAAHPDWRYSRVTRLLEQQARSVPGVQVQDLYARYPDYDIDIAAEQAHVEAARLLVLLHPIQWYSMPPLMKLWLDEVLRYGWAYGRAGTALRGKDCWLVTSTGGPEAAYHPQGYNRYFFDAFLPPYEQTAALCGMRFLPPMVLHGAHRVSSEELDAHAAVFRDRLASYPDWPEIAELATSPINDVPSADRPAADALDFD
ncbi:MAG TPA: NAD(P)H-dependent oxidoreductase [Ramlibacter sp.]|uniref:glutathione-regulated potassium-efflux system oxidoreductase KefF n=1 Tax=Ramlibacter sp. TaxID=1917967 RepID=UPI002D7E2E0A|nr:NAD(P)H-dependent oxidoreductase [Ramlibacter sp.]HET8746866.1 NAD(P)H-dependent oxidoreductase [Ramlibacter sp.]